MLESAVKPHVILSFDVNGTLILKDSKKETKDYMLICSLAKNTFAHWKEEIAGEEKSALFTTRSKIVNSCENRSPLPGSSRITVAIPSLQIILSWASRLGEILARVLAKILAHVMKKTEKSEKMSFKQYVDHELFPGKKSDLGLIKARQEIIANFVNWIEKSSHPCRDIVLNDYHKLKSQFTDPISGNINFTVFPSFYRMLDKLREMDIPFTLVLRSFGQDLKEVVDEIEAHPSGVKIVRWAKFEATKLTVAGHKTVEKADEIFDTFLSSGTHFAVQDDWATWNRDEERGRSGKPFFYSTSRTTRVKNLSLFFDDNITADAEYDIVKPCEINGQNGSTRDLCERIIFPVNTRDAILDDDYFIRRVLQAIENQQETA